MLEIIGGSLTSLICDLSLEKANNKLTGQQDRKQLSDRVADCRAKRTPVPYSADSLRHN